MPRYLAKENKNLNKHKCSKEFTSFMYRENLKLKDLFPIWCAATFWFMRIFHCSDRCQIWHPKTITNCYYRCRFDLKPCKNKPFLYLHKQWYVICSLGGEWFRWNLAFFNQLLAHLFAHVCTQTSVVNHKTKISHTLSRQMSN